jgi:putative tricarboxylic transport membrane protein
MMFIQNANIIYALFMGLMISSVLLLFFGYVAIRLFRFIADVPKSLLFPSVLVLCVFGVYAVNNSVFDIGVMFVMGWLGYLMFRCDIPAAPFLVAFILGPLLEDNFRQSMLMSGGSAGILMRSPITWIFWTLTVLALAALIRRGLGDRRAGAAASVQPR